MCVIASIPAGKVIDDKTFKQMWDRNPDGGGIAYMTNQDKIEVFKSMDFEEFLAQYKVVAKKHGNHDMLVHMRIATHGSVCMDNNHPFWIDPQTVFAHNGIMPQAFHPPAKSDLSDTRYFNQVYLQYVKPIAFDDDGFREQLGDVIGYNKLVILSTNKKLRKESYIINEKLGTWDNGIWYSNSHHLPVKTYGKSDNLVFHNNIPKTPTYKSPQLPFPTNAQDDSYLINPELYKEPDFLELVAEVLDTTGYQELEEVLVDYELEVNPVTGNLHCLGCGTIVEANLDRACPSDCWAMEVLESRYYEINGEYDDYEEDACFIQADKKLGKGSK